MVSDVSEFSYVQSIFGDDDRPDLDDDDDDVMVSSSAPLSSTTPPPSAVARKVVALDPNRSFKEALLSGSGGPLSARGIALKCAPSRLGKVPRKQRTKKKKATVAVIDRSDDDATFVDPKRRGRLKRYRPRAPLAAIKPAFSSYSQQAPVECGSGGADREEIP